MIPNDIEILKNDFIWANYDLKQYQYLFTGEHLQTEMMFKACGFYFNRLYQKYWDGFIITVSRFTDPINQGGNKNLSIYIVNKYIDNHQINKTLINEKLQLINEEAKNIRKRRAKYIAHRDYEHAIKSIINPKDKIYLNNIINVYKYIGEILNEIIYKYDNATLIWDLADNGENAKSLIYYVKKGLIFSEMEYEMKMNQVDYTRYMNSKWQSVELVHN